MNLLLDGIEAGAVIQTNLTRKITWDGITQSYPVYKVRLDLLYYNDKNDRVLTWVSEYKAEHGNSFFDKLDKTEDFNNVIEDIIIKIDPVSIKKIQSNIEIIDQRNPGVVLADGRIIDGNRRFTCLRKLAAKSDKFNYFETVILDKSFESNAKQIRMLELSCQSREEAQFEYNSVDRLAGMYNSIVSSKLLIPAEYAKCTDDAEKDVELRIEIAELMVEFLEFINAPLQFHIARDIQIYDSIHGSVNIFKKCKTEEEKEDFKLSVFINLFMRKKGEMRLFIRCLRSVVGTAFQYDFLEEQKNIAEKVKALIPPAGEVNTKVIEEEIRANDEIIAELLKSEEIVSAKVKDAEFRNRPFRLIEKATEFIESIDLGTVASMHEDDAHRVKSKIMRLEKVALQIHDNLKVK